jgi:mono/diheme cytochrome c family protein
MKRVLKLGGSLVAAVFVLGSGVYLWASWKTTRIYGDRVGVHEVEFPIPFPAGDTVLARLGLGPEAADSLATTRAIARGRHLVEVRYPCADCHGKDFGGGVMIDVPLIGRLFGPNLTAGDGSATIGYTAGDWDRIVRHGVGPDGTPTAMASESFQDMSDQELSDIVIYVGTLPAVDNEVPRVSIGPVGKLLIATGKITPAYYRIAAHDQPHSAFPPAEEPSADFGRHLAATCTGCHRENFAGGPMAGGDPNWPPAANLTMHPDGLGDWTAAQFAVALRQGIRPDGTRLLTPMAEVVTYTAGMSDVEVEALWAYLLSLPPLPDGE